MDNGFRVLQLSTSLKGGAGIAAKLLHENLRAKGIQSTLITIDERESSVSRSIFSLNRNFLEKLLGGCFARLGIAFEKRTFLSLGSSSNREAMSFIKKQGKKNTIIHIHNWFNLLSIRDISFLIQNNFKVVITLHDERLYTGGCHYSLECHGFKTNCSKCPEVPRLLEMIPRRNHSQTKDALDLSAKNVKIIAPSQWISERLKSSKLGKKLFISVIPNCLVLEQPKILNRTFSNQIRIGVASMMPFSYIKGGDTVEKFIQFANSNPSRLQVFLLMDFKEDKKDDFWDSLDFLLVSSRSDNSPNVIHEAHLRGIPVIGTDVGGIPELMETDFDVLVDLRNFVLEELLDTCTSTMKQPDFGQKRKDIARIHYEYLTSSVDQHLQIYQELNSKI